MNATTTNAVTSRDEKFTKVELVLPKGRLSYPHLLERNDGGNFPSGKYETLYLIPKSTDISKIQEAIALLLKENFGGKIKSQDALKHPPLRDGDAEGKNPGFWFLKAKSDYKPKVVGPNPSKLLEDPEMIFGGQNARIGVTFFVYDTKVAKGIGISLGNVQIIGGGESFGGGGKNPEDQFENEETNSVDDDGGDHF